MKPDAPHVIRFIDSHTGGEPTRLVLEGGPDLGSGLLADRARRFVADFDRFRTAIVGEPRGSDVMVGALLVPPHAADCPFGVIFFNNVGVLGMCGHGTIGVVASLAGAGRVRAGLVRIETPVGIVAARLLPDGGVAVENVPSHRRAAGVVVDVPGHGPLRGDVAWGGNWFFLTEDHGQELAAARVGALVEFAGRVRAAVNAQGFPEVDHVELVGPARTAGVDRRCFVLCPGGAWDRSPCGTGLSAKLACLAADGKLAEGAEWTQESVIGSVFRGRYRRDGERILPTITGTAHVSAEGVLHLDPRDPFRWGIRPS